MTIINTSFKKESEDRYLTYALSVVSGRALPDVRDGLKPVQRRILYAMLNDLNLKPSGSYKKSATVVGAVLGKYHPHGDSACYEAMVRMAQDFSLRYPLVDGQGNFGSLDGDSAAAYRYTEVKLQEIALEVLGEIKEETVDFRDNFDASAQEPSDLPSSLPNLLVNGSTGIAVGMATSIPPHNLKDTVSALIYLLKEPTVSVSKLVSFIKGPDFPTGCLILNSKQELDEIYATGKGAIRMRGEWAAEKESRGITPLVISSIPYTVNKAQLVEKIANLIIDKKVPQLIDIRDESTKEVRVVLEMKSEANANDVMEFLYKNTPLETTFSVNLTALVPKAKSLIPMQLDLKTLLQEFLNFRTDVVRKRLAFEKKNLLERIHILEGFVKIFDALDEAIKIVRKSSGRQDSAEKLQKRFKLSEIQSYAIVDLRIYQLSQTNIDEIEKELAEKLKRLKEIEKILKSNKEVALLVEKDLETVSKTFGDSRKSKIVKDFVEVEIDAQAFVVKEDVYTIITKDGWIKRIRQNNDIATTRIREGDKILKAHPLSSVDKVVFFTNLGNVYCLDVNDFPSSSGYGDPIQKHLKFKDGEKIVESYGLRSGKSEAHQENYKFYLKIEDSVCFITQKGIGYSTKLEGVSEIKRSGKKVIKLKTGDNLKVVCPKNKKLSFITKQAYGLTIDSKEILERSSPAVGINLIGVRKDDELVGAISWNGASLFKVILANGKDKELDIKDIKLGKRSLKGNKLNVKSDILEVVENG